MLNLELTEVEADALDALLSAELTDGYLSHSQTRIAAWRSIRKNLRAAQIKDFRRLITPPDWCPRKQEATE